MPAPKSTSKAFAQGTASLAIALPTVAAGDLILLRASTNASNDTISHNGTGYTTIQSPAPGLMSGMMVAKVADATDPGKTITFTYGISSRVAAMAVVIAAGNFDSANPMPTITSNDVSVESTSQTFTGVTVPSGSTVLLWGSMQGTANAGAVVWTAPPGTTSLNTTSSTAAGGRNNGQGVSWIDASGAVGPWTSTTNQLVSGRMNTIVIQPTGSVSGPVAKWWNGTSEQAATLTYWNGTSEVALSSFEVT